MENGKRKNKPTLTVILKRKRGGKASSCCNQTHFDTHPNFDTSIHIYIYK